MESLKRRFKINDSTYHSIIRATNCNSLILNYRDVALSTVDEFLSSHPSVGRIQSLFQSESYMFGHKVVITITAIVELTSCYSTRTSTTQSAPNTVSSVSQTPVSRRLTRSTSVYRSGVPTSSQTTSTAVEEPIAREVQPSSELSVSEDNSDDSNSSSPPPSPLNSIPDEVSNRVHAILEDFAKKQLLTEFRRRFPKITLNNVLKIDKIYVPAFSPNLKVAYFTMRRKAKQSLQEQKTKTSAITVRSDDVQSEAMPVSNFAKKMIAKMTSGQVVNTLFNHDYNTARALKHLSLVHQKILVYLRKHVRGTPCYFKMPRNRIELPEAKAIAYFERILQQNYPSLSLEKVDQTQLCQEPYIMYDPERKKIQKEKNVPTYAYCLE